MNYYWRERVRVHVPIVTQPTVAFHCGPKLNMKAGECRIFDTWSLHKVINDDTHARIHLVADTVGGEGFWSLGPRAAAHASPPGGPAPITPQQDATPDLDLETENSPVVMSPWEAREHVNFLLNEAVPTDPAPEVARVSMVRAQLAWPLVDVRRERGGLAALSRRARCVQGRSAGVRAERLRLRNTASFAVSMFNIAHRSRARRSVARRRRGRQPATAAAAVSAAQTDRTRCSIAPCSLSVRRVPVPRFCLKRSRARRASHDRRWEPRTDRKPAAAQPRRATGPRTGSPSRRRSGRCRGAAFALSPSLRDRARERAPQGRVRLLEKTPKNALRIPFLQRRFPERASSISIAIRARRWRR